jgi:SAM-dependent methyltransferase
LQHVLEHINNPAELLKEIFRILKSDGKVVIEVPNYDSLEARLFREKWSAIDAPRHLYLFTPSTLIKLLEQSGFEVERVGFNPTPVSLSRSIEFLWRKRNHKLIPKTISKYFAYLFLPFSLAAALVKKGASLIVSVHKNISD